MLLKKLPVESIIGSKSSLWTIEWSWFWFWLMYAVNRSCVLISSISTLLDSSLFVSIEAKIQ